jgi:hypothetical protein
LENVLKATQVTKFKDRDTLRMLLEAALASPPSPTDSSPGSSKENHSRQINGEGIMNEKEAKQLRAIKRLMEVKGFESMMKFLDS